MLLIIKSYQQFYIVINNILWITFIAICITICYNLSKIKKGVFDYDKNRVGNFTKAERKT
jgi:hypothetical protein